MTLWLERCAYIYKMTNSPLVGISRLDQENWCWCNVIWQVLVVFCTFLHKTLHLHVRSIITWHFTRGTYHYLIQGCLKKRSKTRTKSSEICELWKLVLTLKLKIYSCMSLARALFSILLRCGTSLAHIYSLSGIEMYLQSILGFTLL